LRAGIGVMVATIALVTPGARLVGAVICTSISTSSVPNWNHEVALIPKGDSLPPH
jgi:hypothetical protein